MDTFLSTVRSRQRSLVLQKCRAEIPHRRRNKCGETGERNKLISYPVSVFALSISIQVQGIAYRKSLKCVIMCCLLLRLGKIFSYELLEQQWISECQLGFLRKPVSQCVQKTVRGANSSLTKQDSGAPCPFVWVLDVPVFNPVWVAADPELFGFQFQGCALTNILINTFAPVGSHADSSLVQAHPAGFDRAAHVSKTRRIWLSLNYDSWRLKWNKDQTWDGFLPSCCI